MWNVLMAIINIIMCLTLLLNVRDYDKEGKTGAIGIMVIMGINAVLLLMK